MLCIFLSQKKLDLRRHIWKHGRSWVSHTDFQTPPFRRTVRRMSRRDYWYVHGSEKRRKFCTFSYGICRYHDKLTSGRKLVPEGREWTKYLVKKHFIAEHTFLYMRGSTCSAYIDKVFRGWCSALVCLHGNGASTVVVLCYESRALLPA